MRRYKSPFLRREWIEACQLVILWQSSLSPFLRREWIEAVHLGSLQPHSMSPFLRREWIEAGGMPVAGAEFTVSLLAKGVD